MHSVIRQIVNKLKVYVVYLTKADDLGAQPQEVQQVSIEAGRVATHFD